PLTGSPVPASVRDRLRGWPAPLLGAFLAALHGAAAQASPASARVFHDRVCRVAGVRSRDWIGFIDLYSRRPEVVHLFANRLRLLALARNRRVSFEDEPISASDLLARVAGNGVPDDRLRERLDTAGG